MVSAVVAVVAAVLLPVASTIVPVGAAGAVWNVSRIGAPSSAPGVVVAVVDTGVDAAHPALAGRVLPQLDFTGSPQAGDPEGHGTHVSGTVAGTPIDCGGGPVAIGVAPDTTILPVRVLDADGSGTVAHVVAGIRAAADHHAAVINLSLGGDLSFLDGGGSDFRDAITYAWNKGSIPVLAAGNSGVLGGVFGSGYGDLDAVVVTATTNADTKASYASSVGSAKWGIAAPGGDGSGTPAGDVLSAYPGQRCALLAGTSMAAPHVSGALAALRARGLGPQQAVDRLLATARRIGPASTFGAGLVDVAAATLGLGGSPPSSPPPTPALTTTTTSLRPRANGGSTTGTRVGSSPDHPVPASGTSHLGAGGTFHDPHLHHRSAVVRAANRSARRRRRGRRPDRHAPPRPPGESGGGRCAERALLVGLAAA